MVVPTKGNYLPVTRQIFSIYLNVKCNERSLPQYFPGRAFEEVCMLDYDLAMMQGRLHENTLSDLQFLNSHLIGKLGRKRSLSERSLKGQALATVSAIKRINNINDKEDNKNGTDNLDSSTGA